MRNSMNRYQDTVNTRTTRTSRTSIGIAAILAGTMMLAGGLLDEPVEAMLEGLRAQIFCDEGLGPRSAGEMRFNARGDFLVNLYGLPPHTKLSCALECGLMGTPVEFPECATADALGNLQARYNRVVRKFGGTCSDLRVTFNAVSLGGLLCSTGAAPKNPIVIVENPDRPPHTSRSRDTDDDGKHDRFIVGTEGGARVYGPGKVDNDPQDSEVIVVDPNRTSTTSYGFDTDGDGDRDVVVVGTQGGSWVSGISNVDNDPNDSEIIVADPSRSPNQSYGIDLDGDGDHDIIVIGTKDGGQVQGDGNIDSDAQDKEIIVNDPNIEPHQSHGIDLDGDGDHDISVVGTKPTGQ